MSALTDAGGLRGAASPPCRGRHPSVRTVLTTGVAIGLVIGLATAAVVLLPAERAAAVLLVAALLVGTFRRLTSWTGLLLLLTSVIMLLPIQRYEIPVGLPFTLEPYRLLLLALLVLLAVAFLVDPRVRLRRLGFGGIVAGYLGAVVVSVACNVGPLREAGRATAAVGAVVNATFLFSVLLLVRVLLTSARVVDLLLMVLVGSGAVVGLSATIERITSTNIFLDYGNVLPLTLINPDFESARVGGARAFGSAAHPIALSAVMTMLAPIAVYLVVHARWPRTSFGRTTVWGGATILLLLGTVASVSRTGAVMLLVMALMAAITVPRVIPRLAVAAVPAAVAVAAIAPTALKGIVKSFLAPTELLQAQYVSAGTSGSGRFADLADAFVGLRAHPFFGTGAGSRIITGPDRNAQILDDQYLSTALESGLVGLVALGCLTVVPTVVMARLARSAAVAPVHRDLAAALSCAFGGYAVSLLFYDALAFYQALFVFLILLAVAGWLRTQMQTPTPPQPATIMRERS